MISLTKEDYLELKSCPFCGEDSSQNIKLYNDSFTKGEVVRCKFCGVVYSKNKLNDNGLNKFWKDYESRVHMIDQKKVNDRVKMYQLDADYVFGYIKHGNMLDIGCGNGDFMSYFQRQGMQVEGVEFGEEAANIASKRAKTYFGKFDELIIDNKYNLITFRGVLQYVDKPKTYLKKAVSLLKENGYIYITAQPNADSFCFNLFQEKFVLPVNAADYLAYNKNCLVNYLGSLGMKLCGEKYFYEETPYADIQNDVICVSNAINQKMTEGQIREKCPAFWGNMMSLLFVKSC